MGRQIKFGIIGCGKIGEKRAVNLPKGSISAFIDTDAKKALELAIKYGSVAGCDYKNFLSDDKIDAFIVATPYNLSAKICMDCMRSGKHVLVEKPGAIHVSDFLEMMESCKKNNVILHIGYNHRFHPAFIEAKRNIDKLGKLFRINAHYGHGGAFLSSDGWRTNISYGDLLDKGCHLIDLTQFFFEGQPIEKITGFVPTLYWDKKCEDNSITILEFQDKIALLSTSCTDWRNNFEFNIFGTGGKIKIEGLGGSYGVERIEQDILVPEKEKPLVEINEYLVDDSWEKENDYFIDLIENNKFEKSNQDNIQCLITLKVIEAIYKNN